MNTKGEILIRHIIFGAIIIAMLSIAGVSMITDVIQNNPSLAGSNELEYFNRTFNTNMRTGIEEQANKLEGNITGTGIENIPAVGPTASLIMRTWGYIKGAFSTLNFVKVMFTDGLTASGIPFPAWVGYFIGVSLVFLVGFIILSLIFKGNI